MTQDYFAVFHLLPSFDLDSAALEKHYFELQRQIHPDKMLGKTPAERQRALSFSMSANEAYEALKSPLKRAQHLLALKNIHVGGEQDSVKPSQALLVEMMELRETLAEAVKPEDLEKLARDAERETSKTLSALSVTFAASDSDSAGQLTIRLGYLVKLAEEIRLKKKAVA